MIQIGQKAPDFTLTDSEGNMVSLQSFQGHKNVVLILYPGDDTEGCTKQLCAVKNDIEEFQKRNTVVLGINHAGADSHQAFINKYGLKNPLLIDEDRKVIEQYGALKEDGETERSVILIDQEGIIRYIERGLPENQAIFNEIDKLK